MGQEKILYVPPRISDYLDSTEIEAKREISNMDGANREKTSRGLESNKDIFEPRVNRYGKRSVVQLQAITGGCSMKIAGSCWNCNYGVDFKCKISSAEYLRAFRRLILQYGDCDTLVIEALGSITDGREFPRAALFPIIDIALRHGNFKTLTLETHITKIDQYLVEWIYGRNLLLPERMRKNLAFEVGVEDFNPDIRKLINKLGVDNRKIEEVYKLLDSHNMELDCNLIYGIPFLREDERIAKTIENIEYAKRRLPNAGIIMFLMSVKENTIMEDMYNRGYYRLPNPWAFVDIANIAIEQGGENYYGFSWFGEKIDSKVKEKTAYLCPECQNLIVYALSEINGTFDREERKAIIRRLKESGEKLECGHYRSYLKYMEELKINPPKFSAKERLYRYYCAITNAKKKALVSTPEIEL